jgi:hypothetical protein
VHLVPFTLVNGRWLGLSGASQKLKTKMLKLEEDELWWSGGATLSEIFSNRG